MRLPPVKEWNHIPPPPDTLDALLPFESIVLHLLFLYRQKIIAKNEEIYEERSGRSTSIYEDDCDTLKDDSNEKQEFWAEKLFSGTKDNRNSISVGLGNSCEVFLRNVYYEFSSLVPLILLLPFHNLLSSKWLGMFEFPSQLYRFSRLFIERWCSLYVNLSFLWALYYFLFHVYVFHYENTDLKNFSLLNVDYILKFSFCPPGAFS